MSERAAAIVLAAGAGRRLGAPEPKAFLAIGDRPILTVASAAAVASPAIEALVITAPDGYEERARACVDGLATPAVVVRGGPTRQASVRAALSAIPDWVTIVAIHDAARPFAPPELFTVVVRAVADGADGAIPVIPVPDTVKRLRDDLIVGTEDRDGLALAQTPQAFRTTALARAHQEAASSGGAATDDAMLLEHTGKVVAVPGDPMNFKITTMLDLVRAQTRMSGA